MSASAWTYLHTESGLWTVGFYKPDGKWEAESDHETAEAAANRTAFLNGAGSAPAVTPTKSVGMSNEELLALAALVNGNAAETLAANMDRQVQGYAMAHNGIVGPDALAALDKELRRRGVVTS